MLAPADGSFYAELAIYAPDAEPDADPLDFLAVSEDNDGSGTISKTFWLDANDYLAEGISTYTIELSTAAKLTVPPVPVTEPTPEPATLLLLSAGLGGLVLIRRRPEKTTGYKVSGDEGTAGKRASLISHNLGIRDRLLFLT